MNTLERNGFAVLRSSRVNDSYMVASALGKIVQNDEVRVEWNDSTNRAYTRDRVPWHTEKVYTKTLPSFVLLRCVTPPLRGGRTLLLDGRIAANHLLHDFPFLRNTRMRYHKLPTQGEWPLIGKYPRTGENVLWYRQGKENMCVLESHGLSTEHISEMVDRLLHELGPTHSHTWKKGDLLVFDNHCFLHAREAYAGDRVLHRILIR